MALPGGDGQATTGNDMLQAQPDSPWRDQPIPACDQPPM